MTLPEDNATLTKVESVVASDDYDYDGSTETLWEGTEDCYFQHSLTRVKTGDATSVVGRRSLTVDDELEIDWAIGDTVTFIPYGGDPQEGIVQGISWDTPGEVDLALEDD